MQFEQATALLIINETKLNGAQAIERWKEELKALGLVEANIIVAESPAAAIPIIEKLASLDVVADGTIIEESNNRAYLDFIALVGQKFPDATIKQILQYKEHDAGVPDRIVDPQKVMPVTEAFLRAKISASTAATS